MAEMMDTGGKKKGGKKRSKKQSTRVDLTPMVDLGFLLVTFFMLTTTFAKPQTMEINLPVKPKPGETQEGQAVKASKAMTIILGENNKVFWFSGLESQNKVETTNFTESGIRKILLAKNAETPDMVVLIKPTDKCNYKNMVDILDEMNITNVKRFALVDATPKDLDLIKNL